MTCEMGEKCLIVTSVDGLLHYCQFKNSNFLGSTEETCGHCSDPSLSGKGKCEECDTDMCNHSDLWIHKLCFTFYLCSAPICHKGTDDSEQCEGHDKCVTHYDKKGRLLRSLKFHFIYQFRACRRKGLWNL